MSEQGNVIDLQDLKRRLSKKIRLLDKKLEGLDENSEEYRRALDAYQKIVKSFLDIYKLESSTTGFDYDGKDELTKLLDRITKGSQLPEEEKKQLIAIKERLSETSKTPAIYLS